MTQMIPLTKLQLSSSNVRKSGETSIAQLSADIEARGLLQNLLVTAMKKPRGHYAVIAGGRRLAALQLLASENRCAADLAIPCKVLEGDDAALTESSLAENFQRIAMTPADECRAFQHFLGSDGDVDAVAKRFGVTRRFVEGRLRLARLAEPVFEALATGEITLDMAKAYAATPDHAKQARIFEQVGRYGYTTPEQVRRMIAGGALKANDPIARLVGEEAYLAAGGSIERELFSEDGDRWADPEIAQDLAGALMEAEAKRLGEEAGLAWVRPVASAHIYGATDGLHRVTLPRAPMSEAEQARAEIIAERMEAIGERMEAEELDEEAYAALEDEHQALDSEYDELHDRPTILPEELKAQVGTFLTLKADGTMALETTYFSETPVDACGNGASGQGHRSTVEAPPPEKIAPGGKPLSARLSDELAMQRRDILAAALIADPALALDYALFALIDGNRGYDRYGTTIRAPRPQDPVTGGASAPSHARIAIEEAREALDASWTEAGDVVVRFEAFRALSDEAKAAWLAMMVAASLEAKPEYSDRTNPLHARLASILEVDVAKWWRPTSANFFDRVGKGTLLALLGEIGGGALAARYASSKKTEIAPACEKLFAGEAITEAEIKDAALAWVPDGMRFDIAQPIKLDKADDEAGDAQSGEDIDAERGNDSPDDANGYGVDDFEDCAPDYADEALEAAE